MQQKYDAPLPITIIGGYLGAGKTTMVNHLLRAADGLRLAVLVNEFGALPIDEDLIEAQDDDIISIAGGCVCCSYGDDLTMALYDLIKMEPRPDHVLLESSGVALPGAIAASVSLIDGYQLDGVIVLADAETIREQANDTYIGDTITRQIGDADLIVLNKADLQTEAQIADSIAWLKEQNQNLEIIPASHSKLPPETLMQSFIGRERHEGTGHVHQANIFATKHFPVDDVMNPQHLAEGLASQELNLVRAKGFVEDSGGSQFAIQVVGRRWNVTPVKSDASNGLVAIAHKDDLNVSAIEDLIAVSRLS